MLQLDVLHVAPASGELGVMLPLLHVNPAVPVVGAVASFAPTQDPLAMVWAGDRYVHACPATVHVKDVLAATLQEV